MADRSTIARPYAKAAFAQATGSGALDAWSTLLDRGAACVTDPRVAALIGSPKATPAQLAELVTDVAGNVVAGSTGIDAGGRNFLRLLAENRRLGFLPEIARRFQVLKDESEGLVDVQVTTAAPIAGNELHDISAALAKRFNRKVRVHTQVDPALIGGAVVRAGDTVIDGSIKSRLERLAFELTA
jgi:F-type H+-transporting ATPase subunit delta